MESIEERFKGIAKNYFHAANGVILVFDITNKDSFNKLKYWIDEGKTNVGQDTEIIIAENKVDLEDERKVNKDSINEFGKKMGLEILETSAKTGQGVDEIFQRLVSRLYSNKKIGAVKDYNSTKITGKEKKKEKCGC